MRSNWQSVAELPSLGPGELQVWQVRLSDMDGGTDAYKRYLSSLELDRAERFRADQARTQFVVARAALRVLLGKLLNVTPAQVPISLSALGKPETPAVDGHSIFFNVAHSRDVILIAFSRTSQVGIDVEYFDRKTDALEIARHSFTANEVMQLERLDDPLARQRAFFRCWTRKESVIKADGRGLSLPLNRVEVPIEDLAAPVAVVIDFAPAQGTPNDVWFVSDLQLGEGIAAAVAMAAPHPILNTFRLPLKLLSGD